MNDYAAALIQERAFSEATVISREPAIICGTQWFDMVFAVLDSRITIEWQLKDGDRVEANQRVCLLRGPSRSLLTGEHSALNRLQTLSGTATSAHRYVQALEGTDVCVRVTRKTIPGPRKAQ